MTAFAPFPPPLLLQYSPSMVGFHLKITLKVVKTIGVGFESASPLKKILKIFKKGERYLRKIFKGI